MVQRSRRILQVRAEIQTENELVRGGRHQTRCKYNEFIKFKLDYSNSYNLLYHYNFSDVFARFYEQHLIAGIYRVEATHR